MKSLYAPSALVRWPTGAFLALAAAACAGNVGSNEATPPDPGAAPTPPRTTPPGANGASSDPAGPAAPLAAPPAGVPRDTDPNALSNEAAFACDANKPAAASPARVVRLTSGQWTNVFFPGRLSSVQARREPLTVPVPDDLFSTNASLGGMDTPTLDGLVPVAADWAEHWRKNGPPCLSDATPPSADCFRRFFETRIATDFRRPASMEELDVFTRRALEGAATLGKSDAAVGAMMTLFLSPYALFRWEVGEGPADARGRRALSSWEMASALSFALLNGPPDEGLRAAAAADKLRAPEQVGAEVARLTASLPETPGLWRFLREHLAYPEAASVFKDPAHVTAVHKQLIAEGWDKVKAEQSTKVGYYPGRTDAWLKTLLVPNGDFVRQLLEGLVGRTPEPRAGLLTDQSFLVRFSEADQNDPIRRGKFITERLLCNALPPIPLGVVNGIPDDPMQTLRAKLAVHGREPACNGCHRFLDGIGLAFEAFDDFGFVRRTEAGRPVDATATLLGAGAADGPIDGAIELSRKLGGAERTRQCFVRQAFRYFSGRSEQALDACTLAAADRTYLSSKGDLGQTLAALFASESFRLRGGAN